MTQKFRAILIEQIQKRILSQWSPTFTFVL